MVGMSARRRRRERDTLEYLGAARRFIRAAGERVAEADEFELAELVALRDDLEEAIRTAIRGQRGYGRSWAHIGSALGIKRQSAQERYGKTEGAGPVEADRRAPSEVVHPAPGSLERLSA
jgi:hypothetical protein